MPLLAPGALPGAFLWEGLFGVLRLVGLNGLRVGCLSLTLRAGAPNAPAALPS